MTDVVYCTTVTAGFEWEAVALSRNLREVEGEGVHLEVYVAAESVSGRDVTPSITWLPASAVCLEDVEVRRMRSTLTGFEIACLMKPRALYATLRRNPAAVAVYLDTDVVLCRPLSVVVKDLSGVGLSRHTAGLDPASFPLFAHAGLFNAGVVACSQASADFALWWDELCSRSASHPNVESDFDQRFLDWVPFRWPVTDLAEFGVNIGPWNVAEYEWSGVDSPKISGVDVVLFHVSTLRSSVPLGSPEEVLRLVERFHSFRDPRPSVPRSRASRAWQTWLRQRRRNRIAGRLGIKNRLVDALRYSSVTFRESFGVPLARWGAPMLYRPLAVCAQPERGRAGVPSD